MVAYEKWNKADEIARCYILASMSNVLQHQHQSYVTARDIMTNLKEMFGEQGRPARQQAMKALMSTKMSEGTPVREHLLKMFDSLNTLEVLEPRLMVNLKLILFWNRCLTLSASSSSTIL